MDRFPASALRATLSQALTGLDWSAGMPRSDILERLEEEQVWRGLLRHYLPDGRYFSVADIIAALPDEVAQDPAAWAQAAASREPFDGVTPEGLGAALRSQDGATGGGGWFGAVARSALLPGWGQWHNGERAKALAFALLSLALGLASGLPGAMSRAVRGQALCAPGGVRPLWLLPLAVTYVASLLDAFDRAGGRRA